MNKRQYLIQLLSSNPVKPFRHLLLNKIIKAKRLVYTIPIVLVSTALYLEQSVNYFSLYNEKEFYTCKEFSMLRFTDVI